MDKTTECLRERCPALFNNGLNRPDIVRFKHTEEASRMLMKHLSASYSRIGVHVDVDMDGLASGWVVSRLLLNSGKLASSKFYINDERVHGITGGIIEAVKLDKIDLLIVVDSSCNNIEELKQLPCDVIVLDHHMLEHENLTGDTGSGRYVIVTNMVDGDDEIPEILGLASVPSTQPQPRRPRRGPYIGLDNLSGFSLSAFGGIEGPSEQTSNSIANFKATPEMSGCMVAYEFIRAFEAIYKPNQALVSDVDSKCHQWVAVSLFTDAIKTINERNQWYISKTIGTYDLDINLSELLRSLDKYSSVLTKSFIMYKLAPAVNSAIRARQAAMALDIMYNRPSDGWQLLNFKEKQLDVLAKLDAAGDRVREFQGAVMYDMGGTVETGNAGYCGVTAAKLLGLRGKSAVAYINIDGVLHGSFRGLHDNIEYLKYFNDALGVELAHGHNAAFGFKMTPQQLVSVLEGVHTAEAAGSKYHIDKVGGIQFVAGNVNECLLGQLPSTGEIHVIANMKEFAQAGGLSEVGTANERTSSREEIYIYAPLDSAEMVGARGRVYRYSILGVQCEAFESLRTPIIRLYPEGNRVYARNVEGLLV